MSVLPDGQFSTAAGEASCLEAPGGSVVFPPAVRVELLNTRRASADTGLLDWISTDSIAGETRVDIQYRCQTLSKFVRVCTVSLSNSQYVCWLYVWTKYEFLHRRLSSLLLGLSLTDWTEGSLERADLSGLQCDVTINRHVFQSEERPLVYSRPDYAHDLILLFLILIYMK